MLFVLIRKLLLIIISLMILSLISYFILLRNPHYSVIEQGFSGYAIYLQQLLEGNLGVSEMTGEPLTKLILNVFPATISLCLSATLLSLMLGIPLGFFAALQRQNMIGKLLGSLGSLSLAVPVFWLAIVLLAYASSHHWAISAVGELHPIYAVPTITGVKILDIFLSDAPHKLKMMQSALHHLALPTLVLAVPATLEIIRMTKQRTEYVLKQNYVKVARTRGWSPLKIWWVHILRNTLPPLIPMIARNITLIFAFAMLVENVVSWGGVGRWIVNALALKDYNAISAGVLAIGIFVLSVDLLASLLTTLLDPSQKKDWYVKV
ncbi:ABC transporter permease subunit [Glaesserella parasuis]|uniref:ABC transporter permease subunit n=1 Tax=Glaesserella parasuis TaxID=738 RepID=A0A084F0I7_GLAPU|nr:ABC transporter permease subunit [Glaesserella parasuis]ATW43956.1 peptide ABC transporter permease [Glaesserella parasuis D74]EQA09644.1 binding--dependent transport system inner membrane component family protein [Glaesserella parasuis D74]KEZ23729.1 Peptide transport system permease protein sapB [Glaesserella parasuis]MCT8542926.1 ABC transporter permease subunit [Glaesserella parasuis]MCT8793652.1 ABC transporter permease subunit [Glaesserella parasuis]